MTSLLSVQSLSVHFGGLRAVEDVSFVVEKGEMVGLVGPNGAGKTTIFNSIFGVTTPTGGCIRFDDQDITGLAPERVAAAGISRTFQNVRLFGDLSVRENVMMGAYSAGRCGLMAAILRVGKHNRLEKIAADRADHWIARLGLADYAHTLATVLPLGLQRVAEVARAMAGAPRLILLDEPAAGLNAVEKRQLADLLKAIVAEAGCSLLLVDHDMHMVLGLVQRLVVLDFGRKIADGNPLAVTRDPAVIEAYLGT